jgi:hypothetical protein
MPSSRLSKGQFFVISGVVLVGIFMTMYQTLSTYGTTDYLKFQRGNEFYLTHNIKQMLTSTLQMTKDGKLKCDDLDTNLDVLKDVYVKAVTQRGYTSSVDTGLCCSGTLRSKLKINVISTDVKIYDAVEEFDTGCACGSHPECS